MFVESVDHGKGRFPLVEPAVDWFATHVEQKVVHPAHVPLQTESESAEIRRTRDTPPGAGISVLVKVGSIEQGKTMGVLWKMARNPIDDNADSILVAAIDEMPKFIRITEPTRWSEVTRYLIPPRSVERMLGDRHEFDMRIAQILHIQDQAI